MESVSRGVTQSVRLPKKTAISFDRISELMQINKSDFLRVCIEKLCKDNKLYLENADKIEQYIELFRTEMSKISEKKIIVQNGSWKTTKDVSILMLCDEMVRWSDKVLNACFEIFVENELADEDSKATFEEDYDNGLILVEDIGFLLSPTRTVADPEVLIEAEIWWDDLETKKIVLLLATKKVIEEYSADKLVDDVINESSKEAKEPTIIVVDAEGKFRRSGSALLTPVDCIAVSKLKSRLSQNSK